MSCYKDSKKKKKSEIKERSSFYYNYNRNVRLSLKVLHELGGVRTTRLNFVFRFQLYHII